MTNELYHHGILGQKWGVRRFEDKSGHLTSAGKLRYYEESDKKIKDNKDGSKTIPKGFKFNRVGKTTLDVNASGGLYVSYGKDDASRYIKNLGPTPIAKLLGTAGEAVQHITVKENLRLASDNDVSKETAKLLLDNNKLLKSFNESIYCAAVTGDFSKNITKQDLSNALKNPSDKNSKKIAYGVSSFLGDPNYAEESKIVYDHFRKNGYDAIPDLHDTMSGTSKTATIVINPKKVEVTSSTIITKDIMKAGKKHVKSIEKLKVSDILD